MPDVDGSPCWPAAPHAGIRRCRDAHDFDMDEYVRRPAIRGIRLC